MARVRFSPLPNSEKFQLSLIFACLVEHLIWCYFWHYIGKPDRRRSLMSMNPSEDIRSVTDLKRKTKEILNQIHRTQRPVVLTVNGKADAVLMDTKTYEKHLRASNMMRLLIQAEEDIAAGRTRSMRSFLKEFKYARKISR